MFFAVRITTKREGDANSSVVRPVESIGRGRQYVHKAYQLFEGMVCMHCVQDEETNPNDWLIGYDWLSLRVRAGLFVSCTGCVKPVCRIRGKQGNLSSREKMEWMRRGW